MSACSWPKLVSHFHAMGVYSRHISEADAEDLNVGFLNKRHSESRRVGQRTAHSGRSIKGAELVGIADQKPGQILSAIGFTSREINLYFIRLVIGR